MQSYSRYLEKEEKAFARRAWRRHPDKSSLSSALLEEILNGKNLKDRTRGAFLFGSRRYRRGLTKLERLAMDVEQYIEIPPKGEWLINCPLEHLLEGVLWAIAHMDTPQSHAVLKRILKSKNPFVRADVLEMMAFEEKTFEVKLVLPFISMKFHESEILSALYALQYKEYLRKYARNARKRIQPMLSHPYPNVRSYAIEALSFHPSNRDLVLSLLNDPYEHVRQSVVDGIHMMDEWDKK